MAKEYRRDIDGLRALAILPVVLFHAGSDTFSGGFVGVDVFFVISGYLITSIVYQNVSDGIFSLQDFYLRRVRRIFPALFVVLLAVIAAGWFLLLPHQLASTARAAISTIFSISNIVFFRDKGYFSEDGETQPLLHMWSLSVEEQFYLVMPFALAVLLRKFGRRPTLSIVAILTLISFLISEYASWFHPSAAFYLLPSRAWELAVGSAIALGMIRSPTSPITRNALSAIGLSAIVLAVLALSSKSHFPGSGALLPVLGTAAVILAGPKALGNRLLSLRPMVFIGLISYSLYLWHWPALVFTRQIFASTHPPLAAVILAVTASFVVAWLSYYFVERPFRNRGSFTNKSVLWGSSLVAATIVLVAIATIDGVPSRFSPEVLRLASGKDTYSPLGLECAAKGGYPGTCEFGPDGNPSFAVWGDSHAAASLPAFESAASTTHRRGVYLGTNSCPPILGLTTTHISYGARERCMAINNSAISYIEESQVTTVFLSAYWPFYLSSETEPLSVTGGYPTTDKRYQLKTSLRRTIDRLLAANKQVVVLTDLPWPQFNVPWHLALSSALGLKPNEVHRTSEPIRDILGLGTLAFDMSAALCRETCALSDHGWPLFTDGHHLSERGAMIYSPALTSILAAPPHGPEVASTGESELLTDRPGRDYGEEGRGVEPKLTTLQSRAADRSRRNVTPLP